MANRLSRRQILGHRRCYNRRRRRGMGEGEPGKSSGGGSAQYQPASGQPKSQGGRPYWQKSYSGGPSMCSRCRRVCPESITSRSWSRTAPRCRSRWSMA